MPPTSKHSVWVYFLPIRLTQKGSVNEKPKVTKFKMAEVVFACSKPNVNTSLLVAGSP